MLKQSLWKSALFDITKGAYTSHTFWCSLEDGLFLSPNLEVKKNSCGCENFKELNMLFSRDLWGSRVEYWCIAAPVKNRDVNIGVEGRKISSVVS